MPLSNDKGSPRSAQLLGWARRHGLAFATANHLDLALTHRSYSNEQGSAQRHNERLEFLGDSVLGLVVSDYLYNTFEGFSEGRMASIKSRVVSEEILAEAGRQLELGPLLLLGKGEDNSGGRQRASNLCDATEALIGAVYLDLGWATAATFVLSILDGALQAALRDAEDPKTALQELVQKLHRSTPRYETIAETGPEHAKEFTCQVVVAGETFGTGVGRSRQSAEREAAGIALGKLRGKGR